MPSGIEIFEGQTKVLMNATTNVKTSGGKIARILVASGTGQVDVYDDPAADASLIWSKPVTAPGDIYVLQCPMLNGIRVKMAAAGQLTVIYS